MNAPDIHDPYSSDAFLAASRYSISQIDLIDKKEGGSCFRAVGEKAGQTTTQLVQVWSEKSSFF